MIGDLKHRLTLQEPVRVADGAGGFTETWQAVAGTPDVYAAVVPLSGAEQLRFHQLASSVTHKITMRYRSDVTPKHRLFSAGAVYDIFAVLDRDGEKNWLDILAEIRAP